MAEMCCMWTRISLLLSLLLIKGTNGDLEAYGCDLDWTNQGEHCYHVTVDTVNASIAREGCEAYGGQLASVWSPEEMAFILSLWRFPSSELGYIWLGLRGTEGGTWEYDDGSSLEVTLDGRAGTWSLLDEASGSPVADDNKCVSLTNYGALAFQDCTLTAHAYVCKRALPKVYVTAGYLNHSSPAPVHPLSQVQIFERMYPPLLNSLPSVGSRLAEVKVETEVSCAYSCFSVSACRVFQVLCDVSNNCVSFYCSLYSELPLDT